MHTYNYISKDVITLNNDGAWQPVSAFDVGEGKLFSLEVINADNFSNAQKYQIVIHKDCHLSSEQKEVMIPYVRRNGVTITENDGNYANGEDKLKRVSEINITPNSAVIIEPINELLLTDADSSELVDQFGSPNTYTYSDVFGLESVISASSSLSAAFELQNIENFRCLKVENLQKYSELSSSFLQLNHCSAGEFSKLNSNCIYDSARGLEIDIGGKIIKSADLPINEIGNSKALYVVSEKGGKLTFSTPPCASNCQIVESEDDPQTISGISEINRGVFLFNVGIKDVTNYLADSSIDYKIVGEGQNSDEVTSFTTMKTKSFEGDASKSGTIYLRVSNAAQDGRNGEVRVKVESYTQSNMISTFINDSVVQPMITEIRNISQIMYGNLSSSIGLRQSIFTIMSIYVALQALYFLAGLGSASVADLAEKIGKLLLVMMMFSDYSWQFFNEYMFKIFTDGLFAMSSLIINGSSSTKNLFGFLDPMFNLAINARLWGSLASMLISGSLTLVGILLTYSMVTYYLLMIETVISFIVSFLMISLLISLAPIFLSMILFDQTRQICRSWISLLFSFSLQPTIILMLIITIDQTIQIFLVSAAPELCWSTFTDLNLYIPLYFTTLNIPLPFSLKLFMPTELDFFGIIGYSFMIFLMVDLLARGSEYSIFLSTSLFGINRPMVGNMSSTNINQDNQKSSLAEELTKSFDPSEYIKSRESEKNHKRGN